jgi:hypothetical protein
MSDSGRAGAVRVVSGVVLDRQPDRAKLKEEEDTVDKGMMDDAA